MKEENEKIPFTGEFDSTQFHLLDDDDSKVDDSKAEVDKETGIKEEKKEEQEETVTDKELEPEKQVQKEEQIIKQQNEPTDEIVKLSNKVADLEKQLSKKEIEFPNEISKRIYEYAVKASGNEVSAAKNYLHVVSLDLSTMTDKEKQMEAFVLSRDDISRTKAEAIFNAQYEKSYDDIEDDIVIKDTHDLATKAAEKKIRELQKEFTESKNANDDSKKFEEQSLELTKGIEDAISVFKGIEIAMDGVDDKVKLRVNSDQVDKLKQSLLDPVQFIKEVAIDNSMENGKLNYIKYAEKIFQLSNIDLALKNAYSLGVTNGKISVIKETKNSSTKTALAPDGEGNKQTSFKDAFMGALKN